MPKRKSLPSPKPASTDAKRAHQGSHPVGLPSEVAAIRGEIKAFFGTLDHEGGKIGRRKWGVYAFYDYDDEPIYVGQTFEGLGSRISRHLTNQRTDAVAMNVLDPFEVAEIRVWPLDLGALPVAGQKEYLDRAEYTLFQKVVADSKLGAVLNEKPPHPKELIELPACYARRIIPDNIFPLRKHPDIRLARRASTIASLARVISERKVSRGLRNTLLTQARRLESLASDRLKDISEDDSGEGED